MARPVSARPGQACSAGLMVLSAGGGWAGGLAGFKTRPEESSHSRSPSRQRATTMPDLHAVIDDSIVIEPQLSNEASLPTVCIVGLGYVGLPVAVAFGKVRP